MINFATLQGVAIPEGAVTQIESGGVVLWKLDVGGVPIVLEVEKITASTYAGSTAYTDEQFVLLDIYPKAGGTVSVTYGGLTKTATDTSGAAEPNAVQVYFGTLYGASDSVETPTSGQLTIEGDYAAFAVGTYVGDVKGSTKYCSCITGVVDWGDVEYVPGYAFYECNKITACEVPDSVISIGQYSFYSCTKLASVKLSNSIVAIPDYAFYSCNSLKEITIPAGVTEIGASAYANVNNLISNPGSVIMLPTMPPALADPSASDYSFSDPKGYVVFTVPAGCSNAYKSADGWSEYAEYITEAS